MFDKWVNYKLVQVETDVTNTPLWGGMGVGGMLYDLADIGKTGLAQPILIDVLWFGMIQIC